MTDATKPVSERLRELANDLYHSGDLAYHTRLRALATEIEEISEALREDGDPTCVHWAADRLAPRKEPK